MSRAAQAPGQGGPHGASRKSRRNRHRRIEPYAWLVTGAVGVGIAAAITGSGVAHAEDTAGSADSSNTAPANSGTARDTVTTTEKSQDTAEDSNRDSSANAATRAATATTSADDRNNHDTGDSPATPREDAARAADVIADKSSAIADDQPATTDADTDAGEGDTTAELEDYAGEGPAVESTFASVDTAPVGQEPELDIALEHAASNDTVVSDADSASTATPVTAASPEKSANAATTASPNFMDRLNGSLIDLQRTYFNMIPTARPVQDPGQSSDGAVTGTVGASDPDDDPLTVFVANGPSLGSVQVSSDGKYVYTPSAELAATGGTDRFTVVVRETNADSHTHGLADLWNSLLRALTGIGNSGGTITQVVTVTITKVAAGESGAGPDPQEDTVALFSAAPVAQAVVPEQSGKDQAGLSEPFLTADPSTGATLDVRDYGATSDNSSDDDALAIQRAIYAARTGDVVYIPEGTYVVKSSIKLRTGISLIGESRDGTILASAFSTSQYLFSNPYAVVYAAPGVNNLTVSSFTITQASGKIYNAGVALGAETGGEVSRIIIENLLIEKHRRFGIQLTNANNVLVDQNVIKNASALDGGGQGYGILIDQTDSHNNWIRNNAIGPVIRHGILIQYAHNNLVEGNTVTGTVSSGIDLHGQDEYANEIRYNTVSNGVRNGTTVSPNGAGIEVGEFSGVIGSTTLHDNSGPYNWIHHNTVYNYTSGFLVTNNSDYTYVEDNTFYDNLVAGIKADYAPLEYLFLARNTVYGNGGGILLNDVKNAVVENNTVTRNKSYGMRTNVGTTSYYMTGNLVTGNGNDVILASLDGFWLIEDASD